MQDNDVVVGMENGGVGMEIGRVRTGGKRE